jgi:predicted nucleic acid-binding Zn ribbon protein
VPQVLGRQERGVIFFLKSHACEKCGKKFGKVEELMHHQQLAHESRLYECKQCGMGFEGMEQMRDHAKKNHSYHKELDERKKD